MDNLRKYKSLYSSTCNTFSTGEGVTITPASVTGLPTDTEITLTFDRVDSSGTKTPSKMERIRGNIIGGNFVISSGGRAVEGTEQVHTSPVVEMIWNADDWNDTVDWALVEHGQDGKHTDALVTTLKATGAEINTGTEDAKIVTPKAIEDSKVSITDKVETLTNKTLTSPIFNGTIDGWISANETWAYADANTLTIPAGGASKYQVGDKIKFTQTTVKSFYVVSVSDTALDLDGRGRYTVANDTITSPYYSRQLNPKGFPRDWAFIPGSSGYSSIFEGSFSKSIANSATANGLSVYVSTYDSSYVEFYLDSNIIQGKGAAGAYKTFSVLNAGATAQTNIAYGAGLYTITSSTSSGTTTFIFAHDGSSASQVYVRYRVHGHIEGINYSAVTEL